MKKLKTTSDHHTIYEKRSGRYAVKDRRKRWVQGDDKVAVLSAEGFLKTPEPKAAPAEPEADSAEGTETAAESTDAS